MKKKPVKHYYIPVYQLRSSDWEKQKWSSNLTEFVLWIAFGYIFFSAVL